MRLSRYTLIHIAGQQVKVPEPAIFGLPEKVLQFGAGALLRGVPDYFIDKANRQGLFNGRVVVVETTMAVKAAFEKQDCLYTLCGEEQGAEVDCINAAISRVLHAVSDWQQVLECAHNPELKIIVSNTEEPISLRHDDVRLHPPLSFPGKLLAFLYERFKAFGGSTQSGMVIVPTEQTIDNGKKLEAIVFELAHLNGLEDHFIEWLEACNQFCNSLAEGSVRTITESGLQKSVKERLGYEDPLLLLSGTDRLWAIEGDEQVKAVLSFCEADAAVIVTPSFAHCGELQQRFPHKLAGLAPDASIAETIHSVDHKL